MSWGGICGQNTARITNCSFTGVINGNNNIGGISGIGKLAFRCYNNGNISGAKYTGGIFGKAISGTSGGILNCYNSGKITSSEDSAGGIAGFTSICCVKYCYNKGEVTSNFYVGGIVGNARQAFVIDSYNIGKVIATDLTKSDEIIVVVSGTSGISVGSKNSYFLSNSLNFSNNDPLGISLTNDEMLSNDFLINLNNGSSIWKQDYTPQINQGYPILIWQ